MTTEQSLSRRSFFKSLFGQNRSDSSSELTEFRTLTQTGAPVTADGKPFGGLVTSATAFSSLISGQIILVLTHQNTNQKLAGASILAISLKPKVSLDLNSSLTKRITIQTPAWGVLNEFDLETKKLKTINTETFGPHSIDQVVTTPWDSLIFNEVFDDENTGRLFEYFPKSHQLIHRMNFKSCSRQKIELSTNPGQKIKIKYLNHENKEILYTSSQILDRTHAQSGKNLLGLGDFNEFIQQTHPLQTSFEIPKKIEIKTQNITFKIENSEQISKLLVQSTS